MDSGARRLLALSGQGEEGEGGVSDLLCRCPGFEGDCRCETAASEEDGLCDGCRCDHGCCVDHGHPKAGIPFEIWIQRDRRYERPSIDAWYRWQECKNQRMRREVMSKQA
jgi:hypothetical protein